MAYRRHGRQLGRWGACKRLLAGSGKLQASRRVDRTECQAQSGWVESLAGLALGLPPALKGSLMSRGAQKLGWGGGSGLEAAAAGLGPGLALFFSLIAVNF